MRRVLSAFAVVALVLGLILGWVRFQVSQEEKADFYMNLSPGYFAPYRTTDEVAKARVLDAFDTEGGDPDPNPLDDPFFTSDFFLDARRNLYSEPFSLKKKALYDRTLAEIEQGIKLPGLRRSARFHVTEMYMESSTDSYYRAPVLGQVLASCGEQDAAVVEGARMIVEDFDPQSDYDPDARENEELGRARGALAYLVQATAARYC